MEKHSNAPMTSSAPGQPVAPVLFPQHAHLCCRESLGTEDRRVHEDPRATLAPWSFWGEGECGWFHGAVWAWETLL